MTQRRLFRMALVGLFLAMVGIQFIPVSRVNPAVSAEPRWDSPGTRVLVVNACFDCHSNETRWPWYSRVAPFSWMVAKHVREGRDELNFSEWPSGELEDAAEEVEKEKMPLWSYVLIHPEARLTTEERAALVRGLKAMDALDRVVPETSDTPSL